MNTNTLPIVVAAAVIACGCLSSAQAQSTILYFDNFDGESTVRLHGTTPDTTIGTNTWEARNLETTPARNPMADGSFAGGGSGQAGGVLPFTLEAGKVYTFTLNATISNPDASAVETLNHKAGPNF
jgi:hypothetical protein